MADNVEANAGAGGATFASDDIGGVQYPRAKVVWGADGAANDTSAAAPLPVVQTGAHEVSLDAGSLAALETVELGATTLAALETLTVAQISSALPAGTNNIGDVDVVTLPAIAATASNIGAQLSTSAIMNGTTAITPSFAVIDAASSGDNTIVSADATKKIRVVSLFLVSAGTVNVRFEGGAGGTALTGQMNLVANSGFVLPFNPVGWFETAANTLLNLELSGAISVDGSLTYILV